jgi:hypothetical protein
VNNTPDGRSPIAIAMQWATQVMTICIEMVVPIVLGVWADRRWGTKFVLTLIGAAAGLWLGLWSLMQLGKSMEAADQNGGKSNNSQTGAETDKPDDSPLKDNDQEE